LGRYEFCMLSRQDSLNFLGTVITKLTVTWCSVQKLL
jgi:hypothetical protein